MSVTINAKIKALQTVVKKEFAEGLKSGDGSYAKVAMVIPSSTKSNTYTWIDKFPELREWTSDRTLKSFRTHAYAIENKLWESSVKVERTEVEDDDLGMIPMIARSRGEAVIQSYDKGIFGLLKSGHSTVCYDGQNFFDTDHPVYPNHDGTGSVSNTSNITAGSATSWYVLANKGSIKPLILQQRVKAQLDDITDTNNDRVFMKDQYVWGIRARHSFGYGLWQLAHKSSQALNADQLDAVITKMCSIKRDGGAPLGIKPTTLVVPMSLYATARKLIENQFNANGGSNHQYKMLEVVATNWL